MLQQLVVSVATKIARCQRIAPSWDVVLLMGSTIVDPLPMSIVKRLVYAGQKAVVLRGGYPIKPANVHLVLMKIAEIPKDVRPLGSVLPLRSRNLSVVFLIKRSIVTNPSAAKFVVNAFWIK